MSRNIILIGGMPTAGKSTIAKELSKLLNLPWISTDQIREIMKSVANPDVNCILNNSVGMSADEYFTMFTPEQIAQKEYDQSIVTWPGIETMINNDWNWRDGVIIEGVNVLPKFAFEVQKKSKNTKSVFVSDRNIGQLHDVVYKRGLFGKADSYSDEFKSKEIEWLYLFDDKIRAEAKLYNLPVVDVKKDQFDIQKVIKALMS